MSKSIPEQLRFPPVDGMTVRGDFEGGILSSDFGPLLLRGIDHQIGLTHCPWHRPSTINAIPVLHRSSSA